MTVEKLWEAHQRGVPADELQSSASAAEEWCYLSVLAHSQGKHQLAAAAAGQAARRRPDSALYAEIAHYLARAHGDPAECGARVYDSAAAFTAFARGGGNVGLYRATHQALRSCYAGHPELRLLDLGTGEGHALLPALTPEVAVRVAEAELVEPAEDRLSLVVAELRRREIACRAHATTVQEFITRTDAGAWDLAQETFALLTLSRSERAELFRWLRPRAGGLAFVEFDVPDLGAGLCPRWFRYMTERYERGIQEYDTDRELVAQSFLIPVLLSTLGDDGGQRHHEQPIERWSADLAEAGFTPEPPQLIFDYWWAPAYLLRAA